MSIGFGDVMNMLISLGLIFITLGVSVALIAASTFFYKIGRRQIRYKEYSEASITFALMLLCIGGFAYFIGSVIS